MKKNVIIIVIVVITISLLGLIGIQLYWISNALSVKEANFNRGVSEAISSAIYKYNKLEMAGAIFRKQEQDRHVNRFFQVVDSLNREYYREVLNSSGNQKPYYDDFLAGIQPDSFNPLNESFDFENPGAENSSKDNNIRNTGYAIRQGIANSSYDAFLDFFQKTKIVNDLFDDLFSSNITYSATSDEGKNLLDSLIRNELTSQGIKTHYEFGIYDPVNNSLLAEKTGQYSRELLESMYVFSLFPNVVFRSPEFLLIYFPNQKHYLLTQMNIMSAISTIFILVIISSFTYTIIIIFRQKKLSLIKNDFINNMTHELKTPISTISLACQALRDKDIQKSENLYQNYINVINEENDRLGMMAEKVLQTAQLEKGKLRLHKVGFNLHEVIEDAIKKIDLQLKARHGNITNDLAAEFSFVEADKVHLTNVIFNLLDNAIKYSHNSPEIKISTENVNKGMLIHVSDKGMGINKANQKKIFDTLYRISTGNVHNVKGFGLGLSYVKAIIELHGGYIKLESEVKKGSVFSVFVPFGFE
jgi:two-component system, OmpR family, phosphate regulon sensor histidine kinase PhoR